MFCYGKNNSKACCCIGCPGPELGTTEGLSESSVQNLQLKAGICSATMKKKFSSLAQSLYSLREVEASVEALKALTLAEIAHVRNKAPKIL